MNIAKTIGDAILASNETSGARRILSRTLPPATKAAETILAATVVITWIEFPDLGPAAAAITTAADYANINPEISLAITILAHSGGKAAMHLLETILKPIIRAQREDAWQQGEARGEARGEAQAEARFQAWKERQEAAGVQFIEDPEEPRNE